MYTNMRLEPTYELCAIQGRRDYMEDFILNTKITKRRHHLFCVFDGHGGQDVARFCHTQLPSLLEYEIQSRNYSDYHGAITDTFKKLDQLVCDMHDFREMGSTCVMCLVTDSHCWFANIGDSMAMVQDHNNIWRDVSEKHSVTNEIDRIRANDGIAFYFSGDMRLFGMINVSRSFGDTEFKKYVLNTPFVCQLPVSHVKHIVLASDGVWDYMSKDQVIQIVQETDTLGSHAAKTLVETAFAEGSTDNISAIHVNMA